MAEAVFVARNLGVPEYLRPDDVGNPTIVGGDTALDDFNESSYVECGHPWETITFTLHQVSGAAVPPAPVVGMKLTWDVGYRALDSDFGMWSLLISQRDPSGLGTNDEPWYEPVFPSPTYALREGMGDHPEWDWDTGELFGFSEILWKDDTATSNDAESVSNRFIFGWLYPDLLDDDWRVLDDPMQFRVAALASLSATVRFNYFRARLTWPGEEGRLAIDTHDHPFHVVGTRDPAMPYELVIDTGTERVVEIVAGEEHLATHELVVDETGSPGTDWVHCGLFRPL